MTQGVNFLTLYTKSGQKDYVNSEKEDNSNYEITIRNNIDFILSHFENQHELFPRKIMTSKIDGQVKIGYESDVEKSKIKIFDYFKKSNFIDCKINAFPYNIEHTEIVDLQVKNRTAASFIMIDLDLKDFSDKEKLDKQLKKTQIFLSNSMKNLIQQYYGQEMDIISINR